MKGHFRVATAVLATLLAFLLLGAADRDNKRRAAIVIGNASYAFAPLSNPHGDAALIAATLKDLGFDVLLFYDVGRTASEHLSGAIQSHMKGAEVSILYYAGHAFQYQGANWLLPIDARTDSITYLVEDSVRLDRLINEATEGAEGIKIVVLDACRNNPVATKEGLQPGLAYTEAGSGQVLIAFATSAGRVAYDGTGANSPYTASLANALQQPGMDIYDVFRRVRGDVREATGGIQIPWVTGSIESEFILNDTKSDEALLPAGNSLPSDETSLDHVLWYFIKDGRDVRDFDTFARMFPHSPHAAEAREKSEVELASASGRGLYVDGSLVSSSISAGGAAQAAEAMPSEFLTFRQSGERALPEPLRQWPRVLPDSELGLRSQIFQCDLDAGDPADPQRLVPGMTPEAINLRTALRNCVLDLAIHPGEARLQFELGRVLETLKKYDWATYFYEQASARGYSAATTNLGHLHRLGLGPDRDYVKALDYFRKAAALGNPRARVNVGAAYMRGQGVSKSEQEGVLWYQLAASSGWAQAINSLADAYHRGTGVEQNDSTATELYRLAAEGGYLNALSSLGRAYVGGTGVEQDVSRGLAYLLEATEKGNKYAARFAGRIFRDGSKGVQRDRKRALQLFELSAERGDPEAYLDLAIGYRDGSFQAGKRDLQRGYYYAALAVRFEVIDAEETRRALATQLGSDTVSNIDAEVARFAEQNGL